MSEPKTLPPAVLSKLQEAASRVRTVNTAVDLWEQVFTEKQKQRLGGNFDAALANGGVVGMWTTVYGCTEERAVIEIAFLFNFLTPHHHRWLLSVTGELLDADGAYDNAILHNDLVLNSLTREIYWKGEPIELDWSHEAKWSFVWELAKHAKVGLPIDSTTFGERKNVDYVSKTKSELTKLKTFPVDLADAIEVVGKGTQKLKVRPQEIRLFEHYVGGEIREWTP